MFLTKKFASFVFKVRKLGGLSRRQLLEICLFSKQFAAVHGSLMVTIDNFGDLRRLIEGIVHKA